MYERMLNKQEKPTFDEMKIYCGENAERFSLLNEWITVNFSTEQTIAFPYGNNYGWGISHRKKKKLICNVFAEDNAFSVMIRLSDKQCEAVYGKIKKYTQEFIDDRYPCGDGGWIHYRVLSEEHVEDVQILTSAKCS